MAHTPRHLLNPKRNRFRGYVGLRHLAPSKAAGSTRVQVVAMTPSSGVGVATTTSRWLFRTTTATSTTQNVFQAADLNADLPITREATSSSSKYPLPEAATVPTAPDRNGLQRQLGYLLFRQDSAYVAYDMSRRRTRAGGGELPPHSRYPCQLQSAASAAPRPAHNDNPRVQGSPQLLRQRRPDTREPRVSPRATASLLRPRKHLRQRAGYWGGGGWGLGVGGVGGGGGGGFPLASPAYRLDRPPRVQTTSATRVLLAARANGTSLLRLGCKALRKAAKYTAALLFCGCDY